MCFEQFVAQGDDLGGGQRRRRVRVKQRRLVDVVAAAEQRRLDGQLDHVEKGPIQRGELHGQVADGAGSGTGRAEIVRAVLEGVAQRGADLVEAAETDSGISIPALRVDGGMTDNEAFVQALADAAQRPVEISPMREATSRGAALMAGLAVGHHRSVADLAQIWKPRVRVEPQRALDRDRWRDAVARARNWIPELSGIDF